MVREKSLSKMVQGKDGDVICTQQYGHSIFQRLRQQCVGEMEPVVTFNNMSDHETFADILRLCSVFRFTKEVQVILQASSDVL